MGVSMASSVLGGCRSGLSGHDLQSHETTYGFPPVSLAAVIAAPSSSACVMSINPDPHSTDELDLTHWGVEWHAKAACPLRASSMRSHCHWAKRASAWRGGRGGLRSDQAYGESRNRQCSNQRRSQQGIADQCERRRAVQ
jgi:hypothetical protein